MFQFKGLEVEGMKKYDQELYDTYPKLFSERQYKCWVELTSVNEDQNIKVLNHSTGLEEIVEETR